MFVIGIGEVLDVLLDARAHLVLFEQFIQRRMVVAGERQLPRRAAPSIALTAIAAVAAFLAGTWLRTEPGKPAAKVRARILLAPDVPLLMGMRSSLALSPDGSRLVVASQQPGVSQLYARPLDEETASPIRGTEGASGPFFSADGRFIGFFTDGKLKRVPAEGGTPVVLADATAGQGGSFAPDGSLVFSPVQPAEVKPWWVDWSPDGRNLAPASFRGVAGVWVLENFFNPQAREP
jgi:hypothetical protein